MSKHQTGQTKSGSSRTTAAKPVQASSNAASPHSNILALQRMVGNRRVSQMLGGAIQRDEVINMPAETVYGDNGRAIEDQVGGLDNLRGQGVDPTAPTMERDPAQVALNSPTPTQAIPFNASGGWDGNAILNRLGQYDTLAGTDSDASRCVQAVAMASYIPTGPDAVAGYLGSMSLEGMLMPQNDRRRAALRVIDLVKRRLENRRVTFGDLSWAQEAVHDLFYNDVSGTPEGDIISQISPMMSGLTRTTATENTWCSTPAEVMAQANALPPGGQLIINSWTVVFNSAFDQVEEQGFATQDRMRVEINGRMRWIRRIPTDQRPNPSSIDEFSDSRSGHQLIIMRDNTVDGPLRLYEPETTSNGEHLIALGTDGAALLRYLSDDATNGIFGYIQITGRITPQTTAPGFGGTP